MKISLNNTMKLHPNSFNGMGENGPGSQPLTEKPSLQLKNDTMKYNINATARENSRGRTSFKGSSVESTIVKEVPKWIDKLGAKIATNDHLQKGFKFISGDILMGEALFALFLTCAARPATIMATPTSDPENKQKNKYAATKSAASGIVGLVTTFLISQPFNKATKKAMDALKNGQQMFEADQISPLAHYLVDTKNGIANPLKEYTHVVNEEAITKTLPDTIIAKAKELINDVDLEKMTKSIKKQFGENITQEELSTKLVDKSKTILKGYESTWNNFMKKSNGPIFWPLKAALTVALVPVILSKLGITKSSKAKEQSKNTQVNTDQTKQSAYQTPLLTPQNTKPIFQNFAGVTNNENK